MFFRVRNRIVGAIGGMAVVKQGMHRRGGRIIVVTRKYSSGRTEEMLRTLASVSCYALRVYRSIVVNWTRGLFFLSLSLINRADL